MKLIDYLVRCWRSEAGCCRCHWCWIPPFRLCSSLSKWAWSGCCYQGKDCWWHYNQKGSFCHQQSSYQITCYIYCHWVLHLFAALEYFPQFCRSWTRASHDPQESRTGVSWLVSHSLAYGISGMLVAVGSKQKTSRNDWTFVIDRKTLYCSPKMTMVNLFIMMLISLKPGKEWSTVSIWDWSNLSVSLTSTLSSWNESLIILQSNQSQIK